MNTLTLAQFAQQHREDLLAEAAEYREAAQLRRGHSARRPRRRSRRTASRQVSGCQHEAAA